MNSIGYQRIRGVLLLLVAIALVGLATTSLAIRQSATVPRTSAGPTSVQVHAAIGHQTIEGFGALAATRVTDGRDTLTPVLRARAIDAVYAQVGITMGRIDAALLESPGGYDVRRNDNGDPNVIEWKGFQTGALDAVRPKLLDLIQKDRFTNYQLGQKINTRWASPWLAKLRATDYNRYLDEAAEQVAAACIYWRKTYGTVPAFLELFNEPLSGNHELNGASTRDLVDIVHRAGDRLKREGFGAVRFVVPSEETEEKSYESAAAILGDSRARAYVGAIGYHPYPYGSAYANIPTILKTSGKGHPDAVRVAARQRLRDLARQYHLPLWMTEVSNGGVDARSYDDFRGRAIHIHDELTYADASAYFGMNNMWDMVSQQNHFGSTAAFFREEGTIVLLENNTEKVHITGIGYAIGHYARWIRRGAVRVDAESADPLVQVTAFRDDASRKIVLVLINNAGDARGVRVTLDGIRIEGEITGEQSTPSAYWAVVPASLPPSPTSFDANLPPLSVTTLAARFPESLAPAGNRPR
jgi:O-glycosyl hydrolase